jgi:hypothetical protein
MFHLQQRENDASNQSNAKSKSSERALFLVMKQLCYAMQAAYWMLLRFSIAAIFLKYLGTQLYASNITK